MTLTELAVKRPSFIIVIFLVLTLGGIISYSSLKYELLPDFSQPALIITTAYPGASPLQVEQSVSLVVEEAVSATENLVSLKTQSYEGLSVVLAEFAVGTNMKETEQQVQRSITNNSFKFAKEVKQSSVRRISPSDAPVIQVVVSSSKLNESEFFDLVDRDIIPQLQQISGVAKVNLLGQRKREIQVNISREKLAYYDLTINDVIQAIQANNIEVPVGRLKNDAKQATVRVMGRINHPEEINNIQIVTPFSGHTSPIYVRDIAEVIDALQETSSVVRLNQKPGVALIVTRRAGANSVDVSAGVMAIMKTAVATYGESKGFQYSIADDTSKFTLASAEAVVFDLLLAIIIVALVILVFLHSFRDSIIVLISIPASLISTFIAMYVLGYTINLMTLLGMSLVIGILVDDSIVVLENIHRHLAKGKNKVQAALDGRQEIGFSAMAITLVDVVVFAPITLVNSVIGDLLRQYSVVVVVSTLMSLFVSFTLTPWLASRFGKITKLNANNVFHRILIVFEDGFDKLTKWYLCRLDWALRHKIISSLAILGSFVLVGFIMSLGILGQEMVAAGDKGQYRISLEYDKNISLYQNNLRTLQIENVVSSNPDVRAVFTNVGGASTSGGLATIAGNASSNKSEILVTLCDFKERDKPTEQIMIEQTDMLKKKFMSVKIESVLVDFRGDKPIELLFQSTNYDSLYKAVSLVKSEVKLVHGIINVQQSVEEGLPELVLELDRKKMNQLGFDAAIIGGSLRNAINGNTDAKLLQNAKEYDINIRFDSKDRMSDKDITGIALRNTRGETVPVSNFVKLNQNSSPSMLERRNRLAAITLFADVRGITTGVVAKNIDKILANLPIPTNVKVSWSGDIKRQGDSFGSLGTALIASLILIYLIMVALYDSFLYPFVVLFSIPVAMIGAFIALNLAAGSFSIFTMLGLIMLMGLVAKNGILIVDYANRIQHENNIPVRQALMEAGEVRLRPIIMTTLAMSFGMLPIAVATGASAEWKNGLGIVMIGGLLSSLMLTVFLVPMMYEIMEKLKSKFKFSKKSSMDVVSLAAKERPTRR